MNAFAVVIVSLLALTGCGSIRSHRLIDQPVGSQLNTSVGGIVFRLNKTGDLPNAFGKRDIYGGKVDKGFSEMKLTGIDGPVLTLEVLDLSRASTETTMDRYQPLANRNAVMAVDVQNNISIGNQEAVKPVTIKFDTSMQKEIVIAGVKVTFKSIQPYGVEYELEDLQAK